MTLVLADTSVWARRDQPEVSPRLSKTIVEDRMAMTAPILIELLQAARSAEDLRTLATRYRCLHEIPLTAGVGRRALYVQAQIAARGYHRGPSVADLVSAAAAEAVGAEVWHCDRHYELIAEVTGQPVRKVGR